MMTYYRRNLLVLSATIFLTAVSWNQIIPFLPQFLKELGIPQSDLLKWTGMIFSIQCLASIVATPFWGKMGDKYGRKPMILRAGVFLAAIYYGMSFCTAPFQLLILRFLNGALTGFIPGSMALVSTNTPPSLATRYVAITQTSSAAGQIIGPALGGILASLVGYRGSMTVSGTFVLLCTITVALIVKEPNKPENVQHTSLYEDFVYSTKNRVVASLMLSTFLSGFFIYSVLPFISIHLKHMSPNIKDWQSGTVFAFPAIALMITAQAWTRIGKKRGYYKMVMVGMIGILLSAFALSFCKSLVPFCLVFFASGVFMAGISVCSAAATCEDVDSSFRGRAFGMQISSNVLGAFLAPMTTGWLGTVLGINTAIGLTGLILCPVAIFYSSIAFRKADKSMCSE